MIALCATWDGCPDCMAEEARDAENDRLADLEDAARKRVESYDSFDVRVCPECMGDLMLVERHAATRIDPECECWECRCGYCEE